MPSVSIQVAGRRLSGFTSLRVATSLGAAAATATFGGSTFERGALNGQDSVRVVIGGVQVFEGALDSIELEQGPEGRAFSATARTRTADLIDSQIDREQVPAELTNTNIVALVQRYLFALEPPAANGTRIVSIPGPFTTLLATPLDVIARHATNPGESYWTAIERACRQVGVLATASRFGGLELISPSRFPRLKVILREGRNVLSMRSSTSWADRAHTIVAEGQGDAFTEGWEESLRVRAIAIDAAVRPSRIRVVQMEGSPTIDDCRRRAQWEAQILSVRGTVISVVVPGWVPDGTNEPWQVGRRVEVALDSLEVSTELLIDAVVHRFSDQGITTQLNLVRRDAYAAEPVIEARSEPSWDLLGGGE